MFRHMWAKLRRGWTRVQNLEPGDKAYEWLRNWPNFGGW